MESERAALVRQAMDTLASLDRLPDTLTEQSSRDPGMLPARLSAAELRAIVASLAILVDAARAMERPADDGGQA